VISLLVIMEDELIDRSMQGRFANQNQSAQIGLPDALDKPLRRGVQVRGMLRKTEGLNPDAVQDRAELQREQTGSIVDQIPAAIQESLVRSKLSCGLPVV